MSTPMFMDLFAVVSKKTNRHQIITAAMTKQQMRDRVEDANYDLYLQQELEKRIDMGNDIIYNLTDLTLDEYKTKSDVELMEKECISSSLSIENPNVIPEKENKTAENVNLHTATGSDSSEISDIDIPADTSDSVDESSLKTAENVNVNTAIESSLKTAENVNVNTAIESHSSIILGIDNSPETKRRKIDDSVDESSLLTAETGSEDSKIDESAEILDSSKASQVDDVDTSGSLEHSDSPIVLENNDFVCGICMKLIRGYIRANRHINEHGNMFCLWCCVQIQDSHVLDSHYHEHATSDPSKKKLVRCPFCGGWYEDLHTINYHILRSHPDSVQKFGKPHFSKDDN